MSHQTAPFTVAIAVSVALAACQPAADTSPQRMAELHGQAELTHQAPDLKAEGVPEAVKQFEAYCYRNSSNFKRTVGMAELSKLRPMPKELEPAIEAESAKGKAYIVETTKNPKRAIFLAITEANTCSIYANGYDRAAIQKSLQNNYHLKQAFKDDTGLQITEFFVPNGTTGTVRDTHEHGVVSTTYLKDPADSAITISFMPPDVAKKVFTL